MKQKEKWNLEDILSAAEYENFLEETRRKIRDFGAKSKKASPEMAIEEFRELMEEEQQIEERMNRLMYLPHLMEAVNQKNQKATVLKSKSDNLFLEFSQTLRPFEHWIKGKYSKKRKKLDRVNAKRLFSSIPDLEHGWWQMRDAAKYTLPQSEEEIITNKNINGIKEIRTLREMIESDFDYKLKIKGKKTKVIRMQAEVSRLVHDPKQEVREAAYRALLGTHKNNLEKLFVVYQAVVKDWGYEAGLRGYKSPISMRNFANEMPDEAIETLLSVCREKRGIFQRYFKYKAKKLKTGKLKRFDIYAPLSDSKKEYSWQETIEIIINVYHKFAPEFGMAARKIINEGHVDVFPDKDKRSGAFCATVSPQITPYILLNHTGNEKDLFTTAHELGHGIHSLLAKHLHPGSQQANLPLAETASTLGETLVFEELLTEKRENDNLEAMLAQKMADLYASVMRQNYFVIFEKRAHEKIKTGIEPEQLSELYLETLKEQFEETVEVDPIFKYEWSYIPHIFNSPFYCYAYSFGDLLSLSLFRIYQKNKKEGKEKIIRILSQGGSRNPVKLLAEEGLDVTRKEFWEESFEVIENWQKKLESYL